MEAYETFLEAHKLLINNKDKPENYHYPLRQTRVYYDFYKRYFSHFDESQKAIFLLCCNQILSKIRAYNEAVIRLKRRKHPDVEIAERKLNKVIYEIDKFSNQGSVKYKG